MNTIYYIPIEPLEERYTQAWYNYFPVEFKKQGFNVHVIEGEPLTDNVEVGSFLDINSTIHYKNSQMSKIAKMFHNKEIEDNSIFFFGDIEFWGIESLKLMADMNKINTKITGFLHAASYIKEDAFSIAEFYQKYTEIGWMASLDTVFVATEYHKQAIIERRINKYCSPEDRLDLINKIQVTGNPLFLDSYHTFNTSKKNQIIISNRFDKEKRPDVSIKYSLEFIKDNPDWNLIITTGRKTFTGNDKKLIDDALKLEKEGKLKIYSNCTKEQYHKHLHESKIMITNSIEETFGYCVAEAVHYNTYPLCPNSLSHPELLENKKELLFDKDEDIVQKMEFLKDYKEDITFLNDKYNIYKDNNPVVKFTKAFKELLKENK